MSRSLAIARVDVPVAGGTLATFRIASEPTQGPAVLAVHGITSNSRVWCAAARSLGSRAHFVAVDLRGRGASRALPPPYGLSIHVRDLLAVLDKLELDRPVVAGHSLGAYIAAQLASEHPDRVAALLLVDGGLPIPGTQDVDPQIFLDGFLGPALARLQLDFPDREAYRRWWLAHPAIAGKDVEHEDLYAFADHDLTGERGELRSGIQEDSVRADAAELLDAAQAAYRLRQPTQMLCAPRGLLDDPNPMQPLALAEDWAAQAPQLRHALQVEGVNHYTIMLGQRGAAAVADAVGSLTGSAADRAAPSA